MKPEKSRRIYHASMATGLMPLAIGMLGSEYMPARIVGIALVFASFYILTGITKEKP